MIYAALVSMEDELMGEKSCAYLVVKEPLRAADGYTTDVPVRHGWHHHWFRISHQRYYHISYHTTSRILAYHQIINIIFLISIKLQFLLTFLDYIFINVSSSNYL